MTNAEILELLGGQAVVRDYLRGVEEGSETDRDAERSMLAAISAASAAGIRPKMAAAEPELYAQYCLLRCRLYADAADEQAAMIERQSNAILHQLRYDPRNDETEEGDSNA